MTENGSRQSTQLTILPTGSHTDFCSRPVFTYLKSRGFYAGVQVDGTVIIERSDENERFYGQKIGVADILAGKARHPPYEIKMLMETVKSAEGRGDVDRAMMDELADQPAPGDVNLESPTTNGPIFGIPEPDDPDPFGVLALEQAGLESCRTLRLGRLAGIDPGCVKASCPHGAGSKRTASDRIVIEESDRETRIV